MVRQILLQSYSPAGDLVVVSVCYVMLILIVFSYIRKTRSFYIFLSIVALLLLSAFADLSFFSIVAKAPPGQYSRAFAVRCVYHALLFGILVLFVVYIGEVTNLERHRRRISISLATVIYVAVVGLDVYTTVTGTRNVMARGNAQSGDVFMYGYIALVALIIVLMASVRKRLYKRVMMGFYCTMGVSFMVLLLQGLSGQSSFTVATFLFPVIAMLYIMHSNPYDVTIGAVDSKALQDAVHYYYRQGRDFLFMSLYMHDFDEEGKPLPDEVQAAIRRFSGSFFRGAQLFELGRGHVMLLVPMNRNPDYEQRINRILEEFKGEYARFGYDYKIVIGSSIDAISRKNEYVSFIRSIHWHMEENSIYRIEAKDVQRFDRAEYILKELDDINRRCDLDDPRVLAYCQPVFNIKTQRYDTAEALMRLKLGELGLVFPDQFISLAEENGYIHTLTEIILHKTCESIRQLLDAGYELSRVSVNVSALELKDEHFCDDVNGIISCSGVPGDKIAIELTESRTDQDFMLMKSKISELRQQGIKFYLDDFGTGYSNMERILELPFDIIKFDRSMVVASGISERSRKIVVSLASMFADLNYSVLYEGVENQKDEQMCKDMSASYLQGYKYSRPVPIERLGEYLHR